MIFPSSELKRLLFADVAPCQKRCIALFDDLNLKYLLGADFFTSSCHWQERTSTSSRVAIIHAGNFEFYVQVYLQDYDPIGPWAVAQGVLIRKPVQYF